MADINGTIDQIIQNAIDTANQSLGNADSAINTALLASQGYTSIPAPPNVDTSPGAREPAIPTVTDTKISYEAQLAQLVALLSGQLADYYTKYYPLVSDAYDEATTWLVNTITIGGTGLSPTVEAQIWQRGRVRILDEGNRAKSAILTDFAARGFTLPPGALFSAQQSIEADILAKSSDLSTTTAIESAKIEIDNIKFAVDLAMKTRISAMQAANDYIRAIASAPDGAIKYASIGGDAQARMMSATADLYRARLQRDELVLNAESANQQTSVNSTKIFADTFTATLQARVQAATSAATAYGNMAASAMNQLQTVASSTESLFGGG